MSLTVCGDEAPMVRDMPITERNVSVPLTGSPSSVNQGPERLDRRVSCTVRGVRSTNVEPSCPVESVTLRRTRYHTSGDGSPVVGTTNDPLAVPTIGATGSDVSAP